MNDCPEQSFSDFIRQMIAENRRKVAFGSMHENISSTGTDLILRQRHGQLRIHDGKPAAVEIRIDTAFGRRFLGVIGQNSGIAGFTAGRGNRQYCTDRQTLRYLRAAPEIPDIMFR